MLGLLNGALVDLVAAIGMYLVAIAQHFPHHRHRRGEHGNAVGAGGDAGEVSPALDYVP